VCDIPVQVESLEILCFNITELTSGGDVAESTSADVDVGTSAMDVGTSEIVSSTTQQQSLADTTQGLVTTQYETTEISAAAAVTTSPQDGETEMTGDDSNTSPPPNLTASAVTSEQDIATSALLVERSAVDSQTSPNSMCFVQRGRARRR
jgi:hypothetical protein